MKNPAELIFERKRPFIYLHSYDVTRPILDEAKAAGKSLEVDISRNQDGSLFIGHPLSFYEFKGMPTPANLPLDTVLKEMKQADLYLVLDCKDVKALPKVRDIINDFGAERVLFHSWADSLLFKPYPPEITLEPHWGFEDLPMAEIESLKRDTGVPIIVSARGLTQQRLQQDSDEIVRKIVEAAKGVAVAVNFNLPNGEAPAKDIMKRLLTEGVLTWINVDKVAPDARPDIFLGVSDHIEEVSDPREP